MDGRTGLAKRPINEVGRPDEVKLPDGDDTDDAEDEADPWSSFLRRAFCCCWSSGVLDDSSSTGGLLASGVGSRFFSSGDGIGSVLTGGDGANVDTAGGFSCG